MRLSDEMQRLTEHIHEAYEGRVEGVAAIRAEAVQDLTEFRTAHQEMAAAMRHQLANAAAQRRATERSRRTEAAEDTRQRASEIGEAHRMWVEFGGRMRQARAGVAVAQPARRQERESAGTPTKGRRRKGWRPGR